jgi:lysophospholipase L1-like esterase
MRRSIPLAALAAVTLALAGCGGDPAPAASSPAASTTASAAAGAGASASASATPSSSSAGGLYVALGDSLAAGYQPGGAELRDSAYPALTATRLEAAGSGLTLENLGCSGETTTSLIKGGKCDFPAGSQLEQAEKLL